MYHILTTCSMQIEKNYFYLRHVSFESLLQGQLPCSVMLHVLFAVLDTLHDNTLNSNLSMLGCHRNHNCKVLTMLVNTSFIISYILNYYTFYLLSVFSLAKSLQIILEISATYRLVSYLLED